MCETYPSWLQVTVLRASFSGFLEFLATVTLLDVCARDSKNTGQCPQSQTAASTLVLMYAARVQSVAMAVRYLSSLSALLLGMPLYLCSEHGS